MGFLPQAERPVRQRKLSADSERREALNVSVLMAILHVIHSVDPRSGGPSNALRGIVRAQLDRGHQVAVLATEIQSAEPWDARGRYVERMHEDASFAGADVSILPARGRRRPWSRWGHSPACVRELRSRFRDAQRRPDVVHIHGIFSHVTTSAARLAHQARIPYVLRPAGGLDAWCLDSKNAAVKRMLLRLLVETDMRRAAILHAMSPAEKQVLARWKPEGDVRCIPHGVNVPSNLDELRSEFCRRYTQAEGRRCILFLGRLHAKKRPEVLVEALDRLQAEFPDALLVIAGHDDGQEKVLRTAVSERRLDDSVLFTGFLTGTLKAGAYAAAEVFALPSRDENFGVSVIEAMAHGAAVVVTNGVGAHVHVDQSGCGVTTRDDVASITLGLQTLLRASSREIGRRGIAFVNQHLSWPAVAAQLDEMYHEACRRDAGMETAVA